MEVVCFAYFSSDEILSSYQRIVNFLSFFCLFCDTYDLYVNESTL